MEVSMRAIIFGRDNFVAKKLEEVLSSQGIKVGYGDSDEVVGAAYVFDFEGNSEVWRSLLPGQKLVVISVDDLERTKVWEKTLRELEINWRIVVGENVYGAGMGDSGFLGKAFYLAAKNKNLILPALSQDFSVLAVGDLVEAVLRACFLSGTRGQLLVISGEEINSKIIAEVLIDEAKMTKNQVIQNENLLEIWDENLINASKEILRWKSEIDFRIGAKETMQYFVSMVDDENRRRAAIEKEEKRRGIPEVKKMVEREKVNSMFEVVAEDQAIMSPPDNGDTSLVDDDEVVFEEDQAIMSAEADTSLVNEEDAETIVGSKIIWEEKEKVEEVEEFKMESLIKKEVETRNEKLETINNNQETSHKKQTNKISYWKWGLGIFWGIVLVIFSINLIRLLTFPGQLKAVKTQIEEEKYDEARKKIAWLKKENGKQLGMVTGLGKSELGKELSDGVRAEGEVVELLESSLNLAISGQKIAETFFGESEAEIGGEIVKVENDLSEMISKMGVLQSRLSGGWKLIPGRYRDQIQKYESMLVEARSYTEGASKIVPILPEILGLDGKRREYMVLLQNENEIRATGGFIGSYGILSIEGGKWLNFEIKDIYEADGQLKGHVEPPAEIKKYLGEAGWFMRDANWQVSFPVAAKDIQWFLEKETGRKVDGVIGVNLAVAKAFLGVVGEIYVPDFKEKVNESNLYEQAEFYSENKFFPGSVQKASFLGALSRQLVEEIKTLKGEKRLAMLKEMVDLMERSEIQIALNETKSARVLMNSGWDGAIYEGKCSGNQCVADYLMVVESNFGVNKANYFLYRNMERQVDIGLNRVSSKLKINYENTAKSNNWPGGDYKNYMRIYIPSGANMEEVSWSENGSGEKKIISGESLTVKTLGNKKEVGFLIVVPVGKKINLEFKYNQAIDLSKNEKFSYLSFIQKQSGFGDTGMVTLVSIPEGWQPMGVQPVASVVGGKLLFNQKLDRDIRMGVEIGR